MPSLIGAIDDAKRAERAWMRIQRDPTSIVVERRQVLQTAQTVRIEFSQPIGERQGQAMNVMPSQRDLIVFGVRNHPDATVVDTDLQRGDRFVIGFSSYEIVDVNNVVPGEIQADALRMS